MTLWNIPLDRAIQIRWWSWHLTASLCLLTATVLISIAIFLRNAINTRRALRKHMPTPRRSRLAFKTTQEHSDDFYILPSCPGIKVNFHEREHESVPAEADGRYIEDRPTPVRRLSN